MKKIHLNTATVDNAGHFVDAGSKLEVGKEAKAISPERAKDLVDRGAAEPIEEKVGR